MKIRQLLLTVLAFATALCSAKEMSPAEQEAERIRSNPDYYCGYGNGASEREADIAALRALSESIKVSVSSRVVTEESNISFSISSKTGISSFTTLANTRQIIISEEPDARVFRYIHKNDLEQAIAEREEKIQDYIYNGIEQEKRMNISSALKYFNWAYSLCQAHPRNMTFDLDGEKRIAKSWLKSHIEEVLRHIEVEVVDISEHPDEIDPWHAQLMITYCGEPVGEVDFNYMNSSHRVKGRHARNGAATIEFKQRPTGNFDLQIEYKYEDEGSRFDKELMSYYESHQPESFKQATHRLPVPATTGPQPKRKEPNNPKTDERVADANAVAPQQPVGDAETVQSAPPIVKAPRKTIEVDRLDASAALDYIEAMKRVGQAISSGDYSSVQGDFTDDGYSLFMLMMNSGKVSVVKNADQQFTVEQSANYLEGKSLPLKITYKGGHTVNENLVFRFNNEGKIQSLAYALTKRAEDDIFRQNMWGLDARYAIKEFMEDYQTAFSLYRLDFIMNLFSDDAMIIIGRRAPTRRTTVRRGGDFATAASLSLPGGGGGQFVYDAFTKDEYEDKLKADFRNKRFIKLTFEENEIASQGGVYDNIYWIQLKQFYDSSNYSDIGYLALMIDMRGEEPKIKIRTWNPVKFDLNDLKRRFKVD